MKQMKTHTEPELAEAFKTLCAKSDTSVTAELNEYMRRRTHLKDPAAVTGNLMEKRWQRWAAASRIVSLLEDIRDANEDAIRKHTDNIGYFVLMSNEIKDPKYALEVYRRKDAVEKAFDNLKERLEMKRTRVHSDEMLAGRFFFQFLALMFVSYIHTRMSENDLYRNHTMQSLFDKLDVIERYQFQGQRYHYSEIPDKQRKLYCCFGIDVATTL